MITSIPMIVLRRRRLSLLMAMVMAIAVSCQDSVPDNETAYNRVIDVPLLGWHVSDTLSFPISITNPPTVRTPLVQGRDYQLGYMVRMSSNYRLTHVPMQLIVQQVTTVDGHLQVVRHVMRQPISLAVRNAEGRALGASWGSLNSCTGFVDDVELRFDSLGTYRVMLLPDAPGVSALVGLSAIGITLSSLE